MKTTPCHKPFSQACENNKTYILTVLQYAFKRCRRIFEIGSGTGQHAVFMAQHLPHLFWQTSDQPQYHIGIEQWLEEAKRDNLGYPLSFTVGEHCWPQDAVYDGVFTANTTHIMQPQEIQAMMAMVAEALPHDGVFCQYGPFRFNGHFTSDTNAEFDRHLRANGYGGVQDVEQLKKWCSLPLQNIVPLPANNHMLVWQH